MKVLIVNICLRPEVHKILYPVGLGYIASAIDRAGHDIEVVDMDARRIGFDELEKELRNKDFEAVGFGCIVTGYKIVKILASLIKKVNPKAWIFVGNSVASSIPEILLANTEVDVAVIGEGDLTVVELLSAMEAGTPLASVKGIAFRQGDTVERTAPRPVIANIDEIEMPQWELFDVDRYLNRSPEYVSEPYPIAPENIRAFPVNTARGCAFNCTFCYHVFKRTPYRQRNPDSILAEIALLQERYGVNYINFWDELTLLTIPQTQRLVDAILGSGITFFWTAACRGNLFKKEHLNLLKNMKRAGCIGLGFSLESANRDILKRMNKKLNPGEFAEQTRVLRKAGIVTWTSLVIGYPEENESTIHETFQFCYENDIYPSAGFLLPQPGTPIYEEACRKGFIPDEEAYLLDMGDRQDLRLNLTRLSMERMEALVRGELARIRDKLGIRLSDSHLLKSGKYRAKTN